MSPHSINEATQAIGPDSTTADIRFAALQVGSPSDQFRREITGRTGLGIRQVSAIIAHLIISERTALFDVLEDKRGFPPFKKKNSSTEANTFFCNIVQPLIRECLTSSNLPNDRANATFADVPDDSLTALSEKITELAKLLDPGKEFSPLTPNECRLVLTKAFANMVSKDKPLNVDVKIKNPDEGVKAASDQQHLVRLATLILEHVGSLTDSSTSQTSPLPLILGQYFGYFIENIGPQLTASASALLDILVVSRTTSINITEIQFPPYDEWENSISAKLAPHLNLDEAIANLVEKRIVTRFKPPFSQEEFLVLDPLIACYLSLSSEDLLGSTESIRSAARSVIEELKQ